MKRRIVQIFFAIIFVFCLMMAGKQLLSYKTDSDFYADLSHNVSLDGTEKETSGNTEKELSEKKSQTEQSEKKKKTKHKEWNIKVNFKELKKVNSQVKAWLFIPDTKVSYPVVQGKDNVFYLTHLFDQSGGSAGCLFLDKDNRGCKDFHSIVYGHHMKDGSMLASLINYKEQEYYETHKKGYFIIEQGKYEIQFFSGYNASIKEDAWKMDFSDQEEKKSWLQQEKEKSLFKPDEGMDVTEEDKIITLSTCDYVFRDARFVLHGCLKRQ